MNEILDDDSKVIGHIYLITNTQTNKKYVGQTVSHRKNRNKYRPFGFEGRFKDHISEALCNTKKKQCNYLNNSIRQYGKEAFKVELITECSKSELDTMEEMYIKEYNTLYPNGYNLTIGGKVFKDKTCDTEPASPTNDVLTSPTMTLIYFEPSLLLLTLIYCSILSMSISTFLNLFSLLLLC